VLALDTLRRSRRITPEIELKALEYINVGWQRLLTFEVEGGGFDWYGKPPANTVLSAYGVLEFSDMARVYEIDTRVIDRTREWLFKQQDKDGHWGMPPRTTWSWKGLSGDFVVTSWICWCLAESGDRGPELEKACGWLADHLDEAKDPYSQALALNAFAIVRPDHAETVALLEDLAARRVESEDGRQAWWAQGGQTAFYARGESADVETTALVANALIQAKRHAGLANRALAYLAARKQSNGTWGSTSATVLSLRVLLRASAGVALEKAATVGFMLNGAAREAVVTPDQSDVMQLVMFRDGDRELAKAGPNAFEAAASGPTGMTLQVVGRAWVPWSSVEAPAKPPLEIRVDYDRRKLSTEDALTATVTMTYRGEEPTFMVCADLGVPPAFVVDARPFEAMVRQGSLDKFGLTARSIVLYFGEMKPGQETRFSYELRAKYPVKAKTPKSTAYEYYAPDRKGEAEPVEIEVVEK
jgi:hypothetical protein